MLSARVTDKISHRRPSAFPSALLFWPLNIHLEPLLTCRLFWSGVNWGGKEVCGTSWACDCSWHPHLCCVCWTSVPFGWKEGKKTKCILWNDINVSKISNCTNQFQHNSSKDISYTGVCILIFFFGLCNAYILVISPLCCLISRMKI